MSLRQFVHRLGQVVFGRAGPAKSLGDRGEQVAAQFLTKLGYRIIATRFRTSLGELDLIAQDGDCIVFVEVKTRRSNDAGAPFEAVGRAKQAQLTRLALAYLRRKGLLERPARFDVVSIVWGADAAEPQVTHYRNAFEPSGRGQMFS